MEDGVKQQHQHLGCLRQCLNVVQTKCTDNLTSHPKGSVIKGRMVIMHDHHAQSCLGKSTSLQVYSKTQLDPKTGKGKLSDKAYFKQGKSNKSNGVKTIIYKIKLHVEPDFGIPGAFIVKNQHKQKFFLKSASLQTPNNQFVHFHCNSWVYPVELAKFDRLFFSNTCYLPNKTPTSLADLRNEELINLRGHGRAEVKEWERIYDYDYYNDFARLDKGPHHCRPVLGGSNSHPYPRRIKTGRPPTHADQSTQSHPERVNLEIYVPPDERLSYQKLSELLSTSVQAAVHFLDLPVDESTFSEDSTSLKSFGEIYEIYKGQRKQAVVDWVEKKLQKIDPGMISRETTQKTSRKDIPKFQLPQIVAENEWVWKDDEEFGRQMLAGINPTRIRCLEIFPPQCKNGVKSKLKASDIEHNLDGLTLNQAILEWRIFILDHHDYLVPFLDKINTNGVFAYASRVLLFLRNDATLKPVAIELSLPGHTPEQELSWVYLPASKGTEAAALWKLAKAHVAANDSLYHHLITHWLHTHAVVEPFIIATRRQISVIHPIYRLLDPHFRDTMHINALYRSFLLNPEGIIEKILFSGKISMELSSELYKDWRFDQQGLPADLLNRYMAVEDPDPENPTGVQLLFEDYPYGVDGLEIWAAIKTWVKDYCYIFYEDDNSVSRDEEIQAWWSEIRHVGHGDKSHETWWYQMTTLSDLIEALTTLIWITSALHASVNFGQYAYSAYPPNRPTKCRKFIPEEGTFEYADFLKDPDKYYLEMLPTKLEMSLAMMLVKVISHHTSDEIYLGQRPSSEWTDNEEVQCKFNKFNEELLRIERRIIERNRDPKLKNRLGPAKIPYKLLFPDTSNVTNQVGITGKGIPNSISI